MPRRRSPSSRLRRLEISNKIAIKSLQKTDKPTFEMDLSVVYLDKPLSVVETDARVYVNTEINGFDVSSLSLDRVELGKIYIAVKNRPQGFLSAVEIAQECNINVKQVVFALKVFVELGLIIPQAGRYQAVVGIKRDLTDSSVYRSIKRILG